jgi:isopentenyldiphosphate isomerase
MQPKNEQGHPGSRQQPLEAQRGDELFDVVNERNEVIGRATRREVHAKGLWHRATHVVVEDARGRVFLQKRSMAKDTAPGRWDSACSGHVDSGETYEAAAVRELREEIGVVADGPGALEPLFTLAPCEANGWEFLRVFRLRSRGPFVFSLNAAEIERGEWWEKPALARALDARPGEFTNALRMLWERLGQGSPEAREPGKFNGKTATGAPQIQAEDQAEETK